MKKLTLSNLFFLLLPIPPTPVAHISGDNASTPATPTSLADSFPQRDYPSSYGQLPPLFFLSLTHTGFIPTSPQRDYPSSYGQCIMIIKALLDTLNYLMVGGEREVVFLMAHLKRWKKESAFFRKARKFFAVDVIHRDSPSDGKRVGVIVYRFVAKQRLCNSEANVSKKILENGV